MKNKDTALYIISALLLVVSIILAFQVKKLNNQILMMKGACGEACNGLFVSFNIAGLADALDAVAVDKASVKACLDAGETVEKVNKDFDDAQEIGITGTPGNILLNRETGLAALIPGAFPLEILEEIRIKLLDPATAENAIVYENTANRVSVKAEKFAQLDEITEADHVNGPRDAKIALVEYSDFDCPFCKTFHPIAMEFVTRNTDSMWVFRQYPLRTAHPDAQKKAEASECVAKLAGEAKFWEFTSALYGVSPN